MRLVNGVMFGDHSARLFEEAFLFFTLGKILMMIPQTFLKWQLSLHIIMLPSKRERLRKFESHFNVRI